MILYRITRTAPNGRKVWERFSRTKHSFHSTVGNMAMKYYPSFGTVTLEVLVIPEDHIIEIDRFDSAWERIEV